MVASPTPKMQKQTHCSRRDPPRNAQDNRSRARGRLHKRTQITLMDAGESEVTPAERRHFLDGKNAKKKPFGPARSASEAELLRSRRVPKEETRRGPEASAQRSRGGATAQPKGPQRRDSKRAGGQRAALPRRSYCGADRGPQRRDSKRGRRPARSAPRRSYCAAEGSPKKRLEEGRRPARSAPEAELLRSRRVPKEETRRGPEASAQRSRGGATAEPTGSPKKRLEEGPRPARSAPEAELLRSRRGPNSDR